MVWRWEPRIWGRALHCSAPRQSVTGLWPPGLSPSPPDRQTPGQLRKAIWVTGSGVAPLLCRRGLSWASETVSTSRFLKGLQLQSLED